MHQAGVRQDHQGPRAWRPGLQGGDQIGADREAVDEVGEHLAVVGGRPFVVTTVGQHLHRQLPGQPVQHAGEQVIIGEEHGETGQCLEVLDQVVAADVGFDVPPQEAGVCRQVRDEAFLDLAPGDQVGMQPAVRPCAQRRGVGEPRIAAARDDRSVPGSPQGGEQRAGVRAIRIGGQRPRPVPVVQVKPPQQWGVGVLPAGWVAEVPDHP